MTDTRWNYPTLGFDPLPGDPAVALALKEDARVFGQRMTEEATRLERLAHQGWQGEAADVFAEHLETLPRDLRHCGDAFTDLSVALGNYHDAFTRAKTRAADLEEQAAAAKAKLQTAELAYTTPVIQAPDACPPDRDRGPLAAAEDELGQILRDAHELAERFNESAEVEAIADAIRRFTEFAPDEPRWNIIKKWAGDVFQATPIGAAVTGLHDLINEYAEFFSDLADLLSDVSGCLGLLSIPLLLVPPFGTTLALAAFGIAVGTATIKTSLFAGGARDSDGKRYVAGGELALSFGDVGMNAVGLGVSAKATQALGKGAAKAARASGMAVDEISFGTALAEQLDPALFKKSWNALGEYSRGVGEGPRSLGRELLKRNKADWDTMGDGTKWIWKGLGVAIGGPNATQPGNWAGIESLWALPDDFIEAVTTDTNPPDLALDIPPVMSTPTEVSIRQKTVEPSGGPEPVMRD